VDAQKYLSVNVYPVKDGWRCAVLIRTPGRPFPRLVRPVGLYDLSPGGRDMASALRAGASLLEDLARDLSQTPDGGGAGAP
jgi:hypothetical protein